ncbi:ABC transporter substrate-binding protein [Marinibacterium profundimaris]|uniref:Iron ABC transporter substrate-binding protein n=1 Tax=Marinibacterium profundimaris TaxID=1679460 RepID=A0A225NAJ6_9RHOB|nr:ABC transporter substrate-binding protein [Marinibacterium profundimaris]OWU66997.1 iron ABC transporter substrate-binding protein [Marinibacterium profundimaris]
MKYLITSLALVAVTPALADPVTVQSCDREVTFDAPPQAAVSNDINLTEMMLALELTDHMVGFTGINGWNKIDEEMRAGIGALPELAEKYPSKEVLLGAGADFYFAGWNYGMRVGGEVTPETLKPFGIQVYELTESCIHIMDKPEASMDDMYNDLLNLGAIFGVPDRAQALVDGYRADLDAVLADLPPLDRAPRVFVYDSGEDTPFTAGRYAMPNALIEAAGGTNIMKDFEKSWGTVNWEPVIERNPEVIVIVDYGEVTAEQKRAFMMGTPAFADLDAVKNDRFVVLDYVEATPGPRNIRAVRKLAEGFRAE